MNLKHTEIFDSHLHIIDPKFPLYENQGYLPEPFTVEDYQSKLSEYTLSEYKFSQYNITGGAIVSGSFQKQDQTYLLNALKKLGSDYVGVTQLLSSTSDEEILSLHQAGVRAVRFNLKRGGSEDISKVTEFSNRIYDLTAWHIELYIDSALLDDLYSTLITLPSVTIDHLGLSKVGFKTLLKLAEKGLKVKATGFGRIDFDPETAISELYNANPECLMFGTDLPSTRAPRPFEESDIGIVISALGEEGAAKVLCGNAKDFYLDTCN